MLMSDRTKSWKAGGSLWYGPALVGRPRTRSAAGLAGISAAIVLVSVTAAGAAGSGNSLHGDVSALETRAHRALLDLYAIDTRLHAAQARLAALESESARLHKGQALLGEQVAATRQTLASSRTELGDNLQMLYKQGDVSAFAIVLGAQSLDDALTRLDELTSVAEQSRQVVQIATAAQSRLAILRTSLEQRRESVDAALADARHTADTLAAAHAERIGFISSLRTKERLKAAQIAALQAAAGRIEHRSDALQTAAAPTTPSAPQPVSAPIAPTPAPSGTRTITVSSTGYSIQGRTATGMPTGWGVVAVDPSVIPLGTRLTIPGYGEGVAADTGGNVRGNTIDLWFPTPGQAGAWGRRTVTITLH
jgi:3D (Asp-Asp-Asp) domain-containing protein